MYSVNDFYSLKHFPMLIAIPLDSVLGPFLCILMIRLMFYALMMLYCFMQIEISKIYDLKLKRVFKMLKIGLNLTNLPSITRQPTAFYFQNKTINAISILLSMLSVVVRLKQKSGQIFRCLYL